MKIKVLTIFPEMLRPMLEASILGRAIEEGLIEVELIDIRPFSELKHKNTDDYPFGGGPGMVMLAQPIVDAVEACTKDGFHGKRLYLSPRGRTFDQTMAEELARDGMTMVIVTHEIGFARRVASRVLFIDEGIIKEENSPEKFFTEPKDPRLQDFLSKVL